MKKSIDWNKKNDYPYTSHSVYVAILTESQSYSNFVESGYPNGAQKGHGFNKCWITLSIQIFFTKLLRIDPCEKHVNILGNLFLACSKLVTMAIYVVK